MLPAHEVGHKFAPRPKKRFGQHFLVSPTILAGILRLAELAPDDVVVEIGAGTGTLTEALASRVGRLLALELDRDLIAPLRQRFADRPQVEIVHADALTFDFDQLPAPIKAVANLPYGTAVAILTRLLSQRSRLRCAVIMLQREVAERLYAETRHQGIWEFDVAGAVVCHRRQRLPRPAIGFFSTTKGDVHGGPHHPPPDPSCSCPG